MKTGMIATLAAGAAAVATTVALVYGVPAYKARETANTGPGTPTTVAAPTTTPPPPPPARQVERRQPAYRERAQRQAYAPPPPPVCNTCGVVESVRQVRLLAKPSGGGAVLGGILGAVAGHQLGNGRGRDLATIAGAAGGALLGNHVEESERATIAYDITVRTDAGAVATYREARPLPVGQRVQISGNQLIPQ